MDFHIGELVREGTRIGTVTDVGTVLVQIETKDGVARVVCPWDLIRVGVSSKR